MAGLCQAVFYAVCAADMGNTVPTGEGLVSLQPKLDAVIRWHGVHLIGQLIQYPPQELGGHHALGVRVQFGKGPLLVRLMAPKSYWRPSSVWTSAQSTGRAPGRLRWRQAAQGQQGARGR